MKNRFPLSESSYHRYPKKQTTTQKLQLFFFYSKNTSKEKKKIPYITSTPSIKKIKKIIIQHVRFPSGPPPQY
jgi:hypothetical protein